MKSVLFLSLIMSSFCAWCAQDWKVIAETTNACKQKLQVMAKDGEKFVYVTEGDTKAKLFAEDGALFSEQNGKPIVYSNRQEKTLNETTKRFIFVQPSMVDGNPPKLDVAFNGVKENCKMKLK